VEVGGREEVWGKWRGAGGRSVGQVKGEGAYTSWTCTQIDRLQPTGEYFHPPSGVLAIRVWCLHHCLHSLLVMLTTTCIMAIEICMKMAHHSYGPG
jgi:hypothetical protein